MVKKAKVEKVTSKTATPKVEVKSTVAAKKVAPKVETKSTSVKTSSQKSDISGAIKQLKEVAKVAIAKVAETTAEVCEKACKTVSCANDPAENLKKFATSSLAKDFVKKNKGTWNHQLWLEFCATVVDKGYAPINFDEVGLVLEKEKSAYFASCK